MRFTVSALLLFGALLQAAWQTRTFEHNKLDEASGLLKSRLYPNIFWAHNDSGDKPRLYALDADTLQLVASIKLKGAKHEDWEDLTYHNGQIVIGDIGNNARERTDMTLYFIDEPNPYREHRVRVSRSERFVFSGQAQDCEALFSFGDGLYMLSKNRPDTPATLYRLENGMALKISVYPMDEQVTAADSDGIHVAVLTRRTLYLFTPEKESGNPFKGDVKRAFLGDIGQIEGVALEGKRVHIISEGGKFFSLDLKDINE